MIVEIFDDRRCDTKATRTGIFADVAMASTYRRGQNVHRDAQGNNPTVR